MLPKSNGVMRDPFDKKDCPVFKKLSLMVKWHPRIPENELPLWLVDYEVGNFTCADPSSQSHAVHHLHYLALSKWDWSVNDGACIMQRCNSCCVYTWPKNSSFRPVICWMLQCGCGLFLGYWNPRFGLLEWHPSCSICCFIRYLAGERRKLKFFKNKSGFECRFQWMVPRVLWIWSSGRESRISSSFGETLFFSGGWLSSQGLSCGIPRFGVQCYSQTHQTKHKREVFLQSLLNQLACR